MAPLWDPLPSLPFSHSGLPNPQVRGKLRLRFPGRLFFAPASKLQGARHTHEPEVIAIVASGQGPTIAKAFPGTFNPMGTGTKSLGHARNELARQRLRQINEERFGGNVSRLARAMRVTQSTVSEFLLGNRGAGTTLLRGLARVDPSLALMTIGIDVKLPPSNPHVGEVADDLVSAGIAPEVAHRVARGSAELTPDADRERLATTARILLTLVQGLSVGPIEPTTLAAGQGRRRR